MNIQIVDLTPGSQRDTTFEKISVAFDDGGKRRVVQSAAISSNTKARQLAFILRELAGRIEFETQHLREPTDPPVWGDFMEAVRRVDGFISDNAVWRKDFSAPPEPPQCPPTFEFYGWRVYKPR